MEWIKAKYDRLLLGLFGVIAVVVGALLAMKLLGFKSQFPALIDPPERTDFGTNDATDRLAKVQETLVARAEFKPPLYEGKPISLFVSSPVVKTVDNDVIPLLTPNSKQLRPPIDNKWLYENLVDDLERKDAADMDSDGDNFSNAEEFLAKTNPRDKTSMPPLTAKVTYKECVKDPLTFRFNTHQGDNDMTFRRTEPPAMAFNTEHIKVGDSFAIDARDGKPRFKIVKVIPATGDKREIAVLEDLTKPGPAGIINAERTVPVEMPTLHAKMVCTLGKVEEKTVSLGDEFNFEAAPDFKFTVVDLTETEVTLEFTPPGATEKTKQTFKIPGNP